MHLIGNKTLFRALLAGVAIAAVGAANAQAGSVIGTQTFSVASTSGLSTNSILTSTSFTFAGITTSTPNSGDFSAVALGTSASTGSNVLTVAAGAVPPAVPNTFTFGSGTAFGTFTATTEQQSIGSVGFGGLLQRTIILTGTFTGGSLFPGKNDPASAILQVTLNQNGVGQPVGAVFNLTTLAVPEPTSFAMMGLGLIATLGVSRLRRKMA